MGRAILLLTSALLAAAAAASSGSPAADEEPIAADALRSGLPQALRPHRELFFPPGVPIRLDETRDYAPPGAWRAATRAHSPSVTLGAEGELEGYVAGTPFPQNGIDCASDPDAGTKLAWNFAHRWQGDGGRGSLRVGWWDRGERVGTVLEGSWALLRLSHRVEPEWLARQDGMLFRGEKRSEALVIHVDAPFEDRGTRIVRYRYAPHLAKSDDLWVYVPRLRRVRRVSGDRWTEAIPGTQLVLEDLTGFASRVEAQRWSCFGAETVLAPMRPRGPTPPPRQHAGAAVPIEGSRSGSDGFGIADARVEARPTQRVRAVPRDPDAALAYKDLWLDRQTHEPLYFVTYDRAGDPVRVGVRTSGWSGDDEETYPGWPEVPEPRDLFGVAWSIANVQLGTGVRVDRWNRNGAPLSSRGKMRRLFSISPSSCR